LHLPLIAAEFTCCSAAVVLFRSFQFQSCCVLLCAYLDQYRAAVCCCGAI